jgi:hypothetical protein
MIKYCPRCKTEKPVSAFGRNTRARNDLQTYCKECKKSISRIYIKRDEQLQNVEWYAINQKYKRVLDYLKMLLNGGAYFQGCELLNVKMTWQDFRNAWADKKDTIDHLDGLIDKSEYW